MADRLPQLFQEVRATLAASLELEVEARPAEGKATIEVGDTFEARFRVRHVGRRVGLRVPFRQVRLHVMPTPFAKFPDGLPALVDLGPVKAGQVVEEALEMKALDAIAGPEVFAHARLEAPLDVQAMFTHASTHELTASLEGPAPLDDDAQRFAEAMYREVLLGNFMLRAFTARVESLELARDDLGLLRQVVRELVRVAGEQRGADPDRVARALTQVDECYIETHAEGYAGSHAWALWFATIDDDNWFDFAAVQQQCAAYLEPPHLELRLVKGFDNEGILAQPVTTVDLPAVLNFEAGTLTIWSAQLND